MKNLNTRRWSTPLTMGAGLFVVITGLLMFFVAERPFKFAHELIGIAFSAAIGLHVLSHWRSLSNYFSQRGAVRVLALAWSMGIGLVAASTLLTAGDAEELIVEKMNSGPLDVLAPVAGLDVTELLDRLGAEGLVLDDAGTSIRQLAERYDAEADDILVSLFRYRQRQPRWASGSTQP